MVLTLNSSHYLGHILGFWVTCGVIMMLLHQSWGWEPTQTASHIHISHIPNIWAPWYAFHGHMAVASNSYTHTTRVRFWCSGSLVESKWCHYIMVEADRQLKLFPTCILDIYKEFENFWYTVHGCMAVASNNYTHIAWVRCWGSGSLVLVVSKWCHYVMIEADSQLNLVSASTLDIYKVFKNNDMLSMGIWQ